MPSMKKRTKMQADVFEWWDEFDDLLEEFDHTFDEETKNILDFSHTSGEINFEEKYGYLSAFMESKSEAIRCSRQYYKYADELPAKKTPKRKKTNQLKLLNEEDSLYKSPLAQEKSLSYNSNEMVQTASMIRKMSSFRTNKEDLLRYSERLDPALSSLIGYIDPMGVFKLNIHQDEIYLLSVDMIENIGFFDKLSFLGHCYFREDNQNCFLRFWLLRVSLQAHTSYMTGNYKNNNLNKNS